MSIDAQTLALLADKVQLEVRDYNEETDVETKYYVPFDLETLGANELIVAKITDINVAITFFEVLETLEHHTVYLIFEDLNVTKLPQEVIEAINNVNNNEIGRITIHAPKLRSIQEDLLWRTHWFINCYSLNHVEVEPDFNIQNSAYDPWLMVSNLSDQAPDSQWLKEHLGVNSQQELEKLWAENLNKFFKQCVSVSAVDTITKLDFTNPVPGSWANGIAFDELVVRLADEVTEVDPQTWNSIQQVNNLDLRGKNLTKVDSVKHIANLHRLNICSNNLKQIPIDLDLPKLNEVTLFNYDDEPVNNYWHNIDKFALNVNIKEYLDLLVQTNIVSKNPVLNLGNSAVNYLIEKPELLPDVEHLSLESANYKSLDLSSLTSVKELKVYFISSLAEDSKVWEIRDNLLVIPEQVTKLDVFNESTIEIGFDLNKCKKLEALRVSTPYYFGEISLPAQVFSNLRELELDNLNLTEYHSAEKLVKLDLQTWTDPLDKDPTIELPEIRLPEDFSVFPNLKQLSIEGIFNKIHVNKNKHKLKKLKSCSLNEINLDNLKAK